MKKDPSICCLYETRFRSKDRLKAKGRKKILHANRSEKKTSVTILILDKINLKTKNVTKDKEGHYIMIMGRPKK